MHEWILDFMEWGGYFAVLLLMAFENIVPPVPSELILGIGGIGVERGTMAFLPLLIAGTVGSTLGNFVLFLLAHRFGYERLKPFVTRWGRWLTVEWDEVNRASRFFRQRGHWLVFGLRFVPFLRSVISIPAGLAHMPAWKFVVFTFAGSAIWNTLLIAAGMWIGRSLADAQQWLSRGTTAIIVIFIVYYLWRVITWRPSGNSA